VQDKDLYAQIPGRREPLKVDRVDLDLKNGEMNGHLAQDVGVQWPCPGCRTLCPLYDHQRSAGGLIWIPVSFERFCALNHRAATAPNTVRER
jgi:hypothetical protein